MLATWKTLVPSLNQTSLARVGEVVVFARGDRFLSFEGGYESAFIVNIAVIDCDGQRQAEEQDGSARIGKWTRGLSAYFLFLR